MLVLLLLLLLLQQLQIGRAIFGTPVPAYLDDTLNLNLDCVRKFERVEVRESNHAGLAAVVAYFHERRQHFWPQDAAAVVRQLDGAPKTVVGGAGLDAHVELLVSVVDGDDHGQRAAQRYDARHLLCPRTFPCAEKTVLVLTLWVLLQVLVFSASTSFVNQKKRGMNTQSRDGTTFDFFARCIFLKTCNIDRCACPFTFAKFLY